MLGMPSWPGRTTGTVGGGQLRGVPRPPLGYTRRHRRRMPPPRRRASLGTRLLRRTPFRVDNYFGKWWRLRTRSRKVATWDGASQVQPATRRRRGPAEGGVACCRYRSRRQMTTSLARRCSCSNVVAEDARSPTPMCHWLVGTASPGDGPGPADPSSLLGPPGPSSIVGKHSLSRESRSETQCLVAPYGAIGASQMSSECMYVRSG